MRRFLIVAAFFGFGAFVLLARRFSHMKGSQPVVFFEAGDPSTKMRITRQKSTIYIDDASTYTFTVDQLNKEYLVELTGRHGRKKVCDEPLFVRKGDGKMCGTGLFTARTLTCSTVSPKLVEKDLAKLIHLMPRSDRGVGIEFEFLARQLTDKGVRKYHRMLEREYGSRDAGYLVQHNSTKFLAINACFREAAGLLTDMGPVGRTCKSNSDCTLQQFCRANGTCDDRLRCQHDSDAQDGMCPVSPLRWHWAWDSSIYPLTGEEAKSIGAGASETDGIAFEVTSPKPPHVLSGKEGFQSTYEVLALLRQLGIQAGPSSGFHVHINVVNDKAPGKSLSPSQIAAIWVAYAKFQLIIDEMLSPSRPGTQWCRRLFLGDCDVQSYRSDCARDPCPCIRRVFNQMHRHLKFPKWLRTARRRNDPLAFCNAALAMPGSRRPCQRRYPHQRYMQLNLIPLHRFGTIEFRAHSATYDPVRIARWVQFLVAFVEYYGTGKGYHKMQKFLARRSADSGYKALQKAQRQATASELFGDLKGLVDDSTAQYYASRVWERGDSTCQSKFQPTTAHCSTRVAFSEAMKPLQKLRGAKLDKLESSLPVSSVTEAALRKHLPNGTIWTSFGNRTDAGSKKVLVPLHSDAEVGSWFEALMPEGNVRAELLDEDSIRQGFHEFTYDLDEEEKLRSILKKNNLAKLDM